MKTIFSLVAAVAAAFIPAQVQAQPQTSSTHLQGTRAPQHATQAVSEIARDENDPVLAALVSLLQDAVITRLEAKVSLQGLDVREGRVRLRGVVIQNLDVGLRLQSRAAQQAASHLQKTNLVPDEWTSALQILKLGFFSDIELGIKLKELRLRELDVDAENLKLENAFLNASLSPREKGKAPIKTGDLQTLLHFLSGIAPTRIEAHAGIGKLQARKLNVRLAGLSLNGFWVGVALRRNDKTKSSKS